MREKLLADAKKTKIFKVVSKIDDGTIGFNPVGINSPDWVSIIVEKDGKFLVESQLRYGIMTNCEEFPCGMVENNEKPLAAAKRELEEETGIQVNAKNIRSLGKLAANPAFMNNYMHYFYVNLNECQYDVVSTKFDEHEKLTSYWKNKDDVISDYVKTNGSVFLAGALWMLCYNSAVDCSK